MTTGYFHYKKQDQVLTVYYEIQPEQGTLKYSCSLWKKGLCNRDITKDDGTVIQRQVTECWMRKTENVHAKENFVKEWVTHKFAPFTQGNLKLDDVWLKTYIHRHICAHGRKPNDFISHDIKKNGYKTVVECWADRGHEVPEWIDPETGKIHQDDDNEDDDEQPEIGLIEWAVKLWYK